MGWWLAGEEQRETGSERRGREVNRGKKVDLGRMRSEGADFRFFRAGLLTLFCLDPIKRWTGEYVEKVGRKHEQREGLPEREEGRGREPISRSNRALQSSSSLAMIRLKRAPESEACDGVQSPRRT